MTDLFLYRAIIENNSIQIVQADLGQGLAVEENSLRCKKDDKLFFLRKGKAVKYLKAKIISKAEKLAIPELQEIQKDWIEQLVEEWRNKNPGMATPREIK